MEERSKMILLDGKKVSKEKISELKGKVNKLDKQLGITIIKIGNDKPSELYVNRKKNVALELNYNCNIINFEEGVHEEVIIGKIKELNNDDSVNGIIIELPMPKNFDRDKIINSISKEKDIDGLTIENIDCLGNNNPYLIPCTPLAILDLLDAYQISLQKKRVAIIGKSILVGSPIAKILQNKNVEINLLDSKTLDINKYTKNADIIIIAIGKKGFLKGDMVKEGCVIVDVGINVEDGKVYGDVDFDSVKEKCSYITPVPGGIGPMTIYEAMNNVYLSYILKRKER